MSTRRFAEVLHELIGLDNPSVPRASESVATEHRTEVRAASSTAALLRSFIVASMPAVLVGVWLFGRQLMLALDSSAGPFRALLTGLSFYLPLLAVALTVAAAWEAVFAAWRGRAVDGAWIMSAWLFTALLPASMPWPVAALGMSFGAVFGQQIFGGTGRYVVSPALLGVVFLGFAYPELFAPGRWLPGTDAAPTWVTLASQGVGGVGAGGRSWLDVFAGSQIGAFGTPSALACLAGGAYLAMRGAASWRTLVGGLLGLAFASALFNAGDRAWQLPWYWHLATGSFAFGLAFIATDPTTMPLTRSGRWLHGATVGALTVVMRSANPDHPESTAFALLLASLFMPLFDHIAVALRTRGARQRLK